MDAAEQHLASLRRHHPVQPAEKRIRSRPALRRAGRRLWRQREWLSIWRERRRSAREAPHRRSGWLVAHLRLLRRPTIGMQTLFLLLLLVVVFAAGFLRLPIVGRQASKTVTGFFLGAVLTGAIIAVWGDLFRLPYHSWRIRRRVAKNPWCVLPTTAGRQQAELMARDETSRMVPRQELYDELLPGILDRSQRDTQVIVGEPGAGKTTALVGISQLLARIGIVPLVVPLWGAMPDNIVDEAKTRFLQHARGLLRSETRLDELWQWLRAHRRIVILVDDLDRIAPDGERGFLLRKALGELAGEGLPAVVTTRPAGIPAGLAASAINLENLDEDDALNHVLAVAREQPGTVAGELDTPKVRSNVALWINQGRLAEVPFYLELLARLVAAKRCEDLAPASGLVEERMPGRIRHHADGNSEWNPLWVRFRLLERFYEEVADGMVHRWLGIDERERKSCLEALCEAALAQLAATALKAYDKKPLRENIEEFLDSNDRSSIVAGQRVTVSAHEVVNTAERLRMLDRDPGGKLHFSHRILQAYLAGRFLETRLGAVRKPGLWPGGPHLDWLAALLDSRHPERMTANMTLVFASLRASEHERHGVEGDGAPRAAADIGALLDRLVCEAEAKLPNAGRAKAQAREEEERLDPRQPFDAEGRRADPDDALGKLTTAAEIATATGHLVGHAPAILNGVKGAAGATRWTKLNAIPAIAGLTETTGSHWTRIWEFARDPDQGVRRAASEAIADDAYNAYRALEGGVSALLVRGALKSRRDASLDTPIGSDEGVAAELDGGVGTTTLRKYGIETEADEILSLRALGWVLPAVVSGLREHPARQVEHGAHPWQRADGAALALDGSRPSKEEYDERVRGAGRALDRLVTLAFQKKFPELEASVAQGFKSDAMRHADDPERRSGPGLVEGHRQLVSDRCLGNAQHWYARIVLHQALALYSVAGADPEVAFEIYGRVLASDGEAHPFAARAARQARRVVARHLLGSDRWKAFVWAYEGDAASRRQASLNPTAAQLVADLNLLLNLKERAPEDRRAQFARMSKLPYCLGESPNRLEILGAGCPDGCSYNFCPLKEAPVDEPDGQRMISRAFCRGQQMGAKRVPPWQEEIGRRALKDFWKEMERRART